LRHRYVERTESYVKTLSESKGTKSDEEILSRQLAADMKDDLTSLREELGFTSVFERDDYRCGGKIDVKIAQKSCPEKYELK
jgi:hypothetical protein